VAHDLPEFWDFNLSGLRDWTAHAVTPGRKKAHFNLRRTNQGQFRVLHSSIVVCLPSLRL
jgi:hypothetical protein